MKRTIIGLIFGVILSMVLWSSVLAAESPDQIVIVPEEHIHSIDFGPDPGQPEVIIKTPQGKLRGNQQNQSNH